MEKTAVITGSAVGIGRETAYCFAKAGYKIGITYVHDEQDAQATAAECMRLGAPVVAVVSLDLRRDASLRAAVKLLHDALGSFTVVVNNAGISVREPLSNQSFDDIEAQLRTNLEGLVKFTQTCLPYIDESIINIGSGLSLRGMEDHAVYCATKFGVRGFSQALALERPDLRVFCVNPDATSTRMHDFKRGRPAEQVGEIIFNAAQGKYAVPSGGDINVWEVA